MKAIAGESDKSRDIVIRELSHVKDMEHEKVRELEGKKEAELKMQLRIIDQLKKDKKDLEARIDELIMKQDILNS